MGFYLPVSAFSLPVMPPEHYPERVTVWIENSQACYMYSKPHSILVWWMKKKQKKRSSVWQLFVLLYMCSSELILQLRHCIIHWFVYQNELFLDRQVACFIIYFLI
jgi:hypothetical protein